MMAQYRPAWLVVFFCAFSCVIAFPAFAQVGTYTDNATVTPYGASACGAPATQTLNVPDSFTITDVDFRVQISHLYRTDTNLTLVSPTGTVVNLLTGPYSNNRDNYVVRFDDEAPIVVDVAAHGSQTLGGTVLPVQSEGDPLSDFDGEDAQGNWTIRVCDVYTSADPGEIQQVELVFEVISLQLDKTTDVYNPLNYALPGNDMIYTLTVTNAGNASPDINTIALIDALPPEVEFYNGDIDDGGPELNPVAFSQTGAGMTFMYATDVAYSNAATKPADFSACTYPPAIGYDPAITFVCFNPKGVMATGSPDPTISFSFRARIK